MKKFIIQTTKFILILYMLLLLVEKFLDFVSINGLDYKLQVWNTIYKGELKTDLVIIGNSRAECHYNSKIIEELTGFKTFNLADEGRPINILIAKWQAYLNYNLKPKILIIDVDYNFLGTANYLYKKWQYLPFYNKPELKALRRTFKEDYYLDTYMPLYKYRGNNFKYFNDYLKNNVNDSTKFIKGFFKNNSNWNVEEWHNFKLRTAKQDLHYDFESTYLKGFEQLEIIIDECMQKDITVFLCWSPQYEGVYYYNKDSRYKVDSVLKDISKNKNIRYFNFDSDDITKDTLNFYNHSHLNFTGANLFSEKLSDSINFYYNN